MKLPLKWGRKSAQGFTLIEVLLATAIFSLLLVALLTMSNGTNLLTRTATRNIDASSKLRTVFDRFLVDWENAITDSETPIDVEVDADGNNQIAFLSRVDGSGGEREIAVVRYRIRSDGTTYLMERAAQGTLLSDPSRRSPSDVPFTDADFEPLATGVFRLVIQFIDKNGDFVTPTPVGLVQWKNIQSLMVSSAAFDDRANVIASAGTQWPNVFPSDDFQSWEQKVRTLNFSGIPDESAKGVMIRQQIFSIE